MRQIILDTETTGREAELGHRIIEIGALVIENREITEDTFHAYLNPDRASDPEALAVHGLSQDFLQDKPYFADILNDFLAFLNKDNQKSEVIIHNAKFDTGFFNAEIERCNQSNKRLLNQPYHHLQHYCHVVDSLKLARTLHPNQRNSLDALCKRYNVDNSKRQLHGALLDAELLAKVYLKMTAGQPSFFDTAVTLSTQAKSTNPRTSSSDLANLPIYLADTEELTAHQEKLLALCNQAGTCFWKDD